MSGKDGRNGTGLDRKGCCSKRKWRVAGNTLGGAVVDRSERRTGELFSC